MSTSQQRQAEQRIARVLRTAHLREEAAPVDFAKPFDFSEIFDASDASDSEENRIRAETLDRILLFLYADGIHPGCVMRRTYLLAHRSRPELLKHMSGAELAEMFGETRAAWSARAIRLFEGYAKARGGRALHAWNSKSETARATYARRAKRTL